MKFIEKNKTILAALVITIAGIIFIFGNPSDKSDTLVVKNEELESTVLESEIVVYISGSVNSPGVYTVSNETRIYELIEMAQGLKEDANIDSINLAGTLIDGQRLHIPSLVEIDENQDELVNINTATKEKLMTLPGIGESRALDIIAYGENNGYFTQIEDIMKVSGIKESAFSKIKKYISVY